MVEVDWRAIAKAHDERMAKMQTDPETTKSSNPKDVLAASEQRVLLHLIPSPALAHAAQALMDGARKYGPYNWREEGVSAVTYISATMRHLRDWLDGEEVAADSQVHHLGHAMACLAIILDAIEIKNLVDDRPLPAPTAAIHERMKVERATQRKWTENPGHHELVAPFGVGFGMAETFSKPKETLREYIAKKGAVLDQEMEKRELSARIELALMLAPDNKLFQELARTMAEGSEEPEPQD
jgi:hypothetical protein